MTTHHKSTDSLRLSRFCAVNCVDMHARSQIVTQGHEIPPFYPARTIPQACHAKRTRMHVQMVDFPTLPPETHPQARQDARFATRAMRTATDLVNVSAIPHAHQGRETTDRHVHGDTFRCSSQWHSASNMRRPLSTLRQEHGPHPQTLTQKQEPFARHPGTTYFTANDMPSCVYL